MKNVEGPGGEMKKAVAYRFKIPDLTCLKNCQELGLDLSYGIYFILSYFISLPVCLCFHWFIYFLEDANGALL